MITETPLRERLCEQSDVWVANRALTFDEYLHAYEGVKEHVELVKGVPTKRMAARLEHEKLCGFIHSLMDFFVQKNDLGIVLGSRSAVRITDYDGRLPDILFVVKNRMHILETLSLQGAPDLVIELISPGDRPSEKAQLESDYKNIGVPEIVFVDPKRCRVQVFRKRDTQYDIDELADGALYLESVPGFWLEMSWLFDEHRLPVHEALAAIEASKAVG